MLLITHPVTVPPQQERRILEQTVTPLTPHSSALPSPSRGDLSSTSEPQDTIVRSLADWERKQELLERQSVNIRLTECTLTLDTCVHLVSYRRDGRCRV